MIKSNFVGFLFGKSSLKIAAYNTNDPYPCLCIFRKKKEYPGAFNSYVKNTFRLYFVQMRR